MNYLSKTIRVLIASPDPSARETIANMLSGEQFDIFQAETGQQVLRTMREHLLEVVVLDYQTPFIRRDHAGGSSRVMEAIIDASPFLPVVLVCDSSSELDHRTTMMADMIVNRPLKDSVLYDAIDTVVGETLRERAQRKAGGLSVVRLST